MSAASRAYFEDWQRELSRDPGYQNWLAVTAITEQEQIMNINDVFPSDYIKASDLQGRKLKVTIDRVEIKKMGDDTKPVLFFAGKEKGLVLNKTKAQVLAASFSPETEGWRGKEIAIYPTKVSFQGQMVDSIGVEPMIPMVDADLNDPVPF